jgi:hypothetical protein
MAIIIAVFLVVVALIFSFGIPPHHLFPRRRTVPLRADDPTIPTRSEETQ